MFLERDPLPTPFRRTGGVRIDRSDQHGLDTAYQIRQALAWVDVGEAFWEQGRAWLARSLGAWLRPVKQPTESVWPLVSLPQPRCSVGVG